MCAWYITVGPSSLPATPITLHARSSGAIIVVAKPTRCKNAAQNSAIARQSPGGFGDGIAINCCNRLTTAA